MKYQSHQNEDSDTSESIGSLTPDHAEKEDPDDGHDNHEFEAEQKLPEGTEKKAMINAILVSMSFFFIFFAFSGTQSLLSSILPGDLGYWSLGCIYLSFTIGSLLLSTISVTILTPKWAMFIGSFFYLIFEAANIKPIGPLLIISSILVGLGASLIWAGEGVYITTSAIAYAVSKGHSHKADVGLFQGIFYAIYYGSQILGNLLSSLILKRSDDSSSSSGQSRSSESSSEDDDDGSSMLLFIIYTCVCFIAAVILFFVPHPAPKWFIDQFEEEKGADKNVSKRKKLLHKLVGTIALLKNPRMILLVPYLIYSGLENAFICGDFSSKYITPTFGVNKVGFIFAVYAFFCALSSVSLGKVVDKLGPLPVGLLGPILFAIFLSTIHFLRDGTVGESIASPFVWAAISGVGDAATYSVYPSSTVGIVLLEHTDAAFSNIKLWQSFGKTLIFFLGAAIGWNEKVILLIVFWVLSICAVFGLNYFVVSHKKKAATHIVKEGSINDDDEGTYNIDNTEFDLVEMHPHITTKIIK